ncbi:hypothetical protein LV28_08370 [Pandoraea pnomenusa]|uniref:hypothetical protein n=1 Tax=Pandoraea pnomenusa TaxID=93220 RepID=UPI0005210FCE|nr:hypothetical protein [Pandoraea pnomenusa]AIU26550.1 hypothetical protein LV28_08370 [Pandoraea pnomenusa]
MAMDDDCPNSPELALNAAMKPSRRSDVEMRCHALSGRASSARPKGRAYNRDNMQDIHPIWARFATIGRKNARRCLAGT